MAFFSFPKKKDNLERKLSEIHFNISDSFSKVKEDFRSIAKWIEHFDGKKQKHDGELQELKGEVRYLREVLRDIRDQQIPAPPVQQKRQPIIEDVFEENEEEEEVRVDMDQFTDTQKAIFSRLGILQRESSQPWIPLKHLTQELYPEKQYTDVRSMMSEYVGLLSDAGLVNRTRKGKQTFVSVSKKGTKLFSDTKKKLKPKAKR